VSPKMVFIVSTVLAVAGIVASVTVPEVRCFLRLDLAQCSQIEMKDVELTVESESRQPLQGVSVIFKSKGAPETALTDSNGYVKVKIPETDVQVTLQKDSFEPLNYSVDLRKDPSTTRTFILKAVAGSSQLPTASPTKSPLPPSPSSTSIQSPLLSEKLEVECENFGSPAQNYRKLISSANKTEEPKSRFLIGTNYSSRSVVCKIVKNSGELYMAYALPDKSPLNQVTIKVYIDGSLSKVFDLGRGQVLREKINLTGASGYKLDFAFTPPRNGSLVFDYVYILDK
jgi:hypothetical protein